VDPSRGRELFGRISVIGRHRWGSGRCGRRSAGSTGGRRRRSPRWRSPARLYTKSGPTETHNGLTHIDETRVIATASLGWRRHRPTTGQGPNPALPGVLTDPSQLATMGHPIESSRHDEQSAPRLTTSTNRVVPESTSAASRRPAWRLPALEGGAVSETWPTRTSRWPRKISIRGPFRLCHDLGGPEPLINWSVHGGWWAGMRCSGADGVTATEPGLSVSGECRWRGLAFYPWS